ncbi:MAG: PDZ domain-containing protein [Bacteroidaceae bacterium]|nr:PDZ domain-containing protein [Bacteroidaceae bacterium]
MKKNGKMIGILVGTLLLGGVFFGFNKEDDRNFQIVKSLDVFNSVFKELDMFYVDSIDPKEVVEYGIRAMLAKTDPYTEYYPEEDNTLKEMTTGKFGGIGSVIRYYSPRKRVAIIEPSEGHPAAEAGLKAGDIIMEINGKEMIQEDRTPNEMTSHVSDHLRGEPGTLCVIKVERPTSDSTYVPMEFKITRGTIRTNTIPYYSMLNDSIGYMYISTFSVEGCSKEIKRALIELKQQGATSLIIDLRGNGGGLLSEAVNVVNFFVPKGKEIVKTRGKFKQMDHAYRTMNEPIDLEIPLTVLVDGGTASAAEILSGSLQDLDRAVIIGNRTYGKGLVQTLRDLPYNSSMKITTAKYYIPSGRCVQAIDYSRRNADGSIARTPDSLTNVFHTEAGREVRDGGGIRPDIEVKMDKTPNILFYLVNEDMIFDFATQYVIKHPMIAEVEDFRLTDADYADFKAMLKKRNFSYDRQSEAMLKKLKEMAEFEGYMEGASDEFAALEKKLQHNLDLELDRFAKDIKPLIAEEIVKRYYFERGAVQETLKDDADLKKALEVLQKPEEYKKVLTVAVK